MSDAQHDEHEPLIKTPKQLVIAVITAFAVPILVIILLANYVGLGVKEGAGSSGMSEEAVNDRIKPVAQLELKDLNAPRVYKTGEQLYKEVCATCHAAGVAGAPKFGDAANWASRLPQGLDGLTKVALAGKGGMPARGGTSPDDVSDYEIQRAIVYMANSGGGKLQEPAAPAAGAAAQASASAPQAAAEAVPATPPRLRPSPPRLPLRRRPPPATSARRSTTRPARCATPPVWPVPPSLATRLPGHRASRRARPRCTTSRCTVRARCRRKAPMPVRMTT